MEPNEYTVKWGRIARTVVYNDSQGEMLFTVDASDKGKEWLILEHHAPESPRGPNYNAAFDRVRRYIESCGFQVETYGR